MTAPFTPQQALEVGDQLAADSVPSFVIHVVNLVLAAKVAKLSDYQRKQGIEVKIDQNEIITPLLKYVNQEVPSVVEGVKISRNDMFSKKWLDFEKAYERSGGWKVYYTKGAYCDTFTPYFTFKSTT